MKTWTRRIGATLLIVAAIVSPARAADIALEVTANRADIYLGESVLLTVNVSGISESPQPDMSGIRDCAVRLLDSRNQSSHQITIVNGRIQRTDFSGWTLAYEVTPQIAGRVTIGPVRLTADGRTLTAPGPSIQVSGIEAQDDVRIGIRASRDTVLVDEPFDIALTIAIREPQPGASPLDAAAPPSLNVGYLDGAAIAGLDMPDVRGTLQRLLLQGRNQPGFLINSYTVPRDPFSMDNFFNMDDFRSQSPARFQFENAAKEEGGKRYVEYSLKLTYTPKEEGTYTFGPALFKGDIVQGIDAAGRKAMKRVFAVGPASAVRVIPPPDKGRPPSYVGVIGSDLQVDAALDTQNCNVGDPLTLTLTISGNVNLKQLVPVDLTSQTNLTRSFRVYEDSVQVRTREGGTKEYAYTIRPIQSGTLEVPPIDVSFYDIKTRAYKTVQSRPIPLVVRQVAEVGRDTVIDTTTNRPAAGGPTMRASRLVIAPLDVEPAGAEDNPISMASWQVVAAIAAPGVYALVLSLAYAMVWFKRVAAKRRRKNAYAWAADILTQTRTVTDGNPADARAAVWSALRHYLADRFGVPEAGFTPADAHRLLAQRNLPPESVARFCAFLENCFNSSYTSGAGGSAGLPEACAQAAAMLPSIEATFASPPARHRSPDVLLCLVALAGCMSTARGDNLQERWFIWDQANSKMTTAATAGEARQAAEAYLGLVGMGVRNGPLFYDLGTALLKAGRYDDALSSLLRAERYMGSTPEIRRNLLIAVRQKAKDPDASLPWYRLLLAWHYGLPVSWRITVAVLAFVLIWPGLLLRWLGLRRLGAGLLAIALIVWVLYGSSAAATWHQEGLDDDLWAARGMLGPAAVERPATAGKGGP